MKVTLYFCNIKLGGHCPNIQNARPYMMNELETFSYYESQLEPSGYLCFAFFLYRICELAKYLSTNFVFHQEQIFPSLDTIPIDASESNIGCFVRISLLI